MLDHLIPLTSFSQFPLIGYVGYFYSGMSKQAVKTSICFAAQLICPEYVCKNTPLIDLKITNYKQ